MFLITVENNHSNISLIYIVGIYLSSSVLDILISKFVYYK